MAIVDSAQPLSLRLCIKLPGDVMMKQQIPSDLLQNASSLQLGGEDKDVEA